MLASRTFAIFISDT